MFFYLYALIELLAIFLDSGIIPTANVSYPVSSLAKPCIYYEITKRHNSPIVVRSDLHRSSSSDILLSPH